MVRLLFVFWSALIVAACSPAGGGSSKKCTPGDTKTCTCTDGTASSKLCGDDKSYGDCNCPGQTTGETTGQTTGETTGGETTGGETTGGQTTGGETTGGQTTGGQTTGGQTTGGETTGGETTGGETTGGETTGGETTGGETTGGETTGGETTGSGACTNGADMEIMNSPEGVIGSATNCALECNGDPGCSGTCISGATGLSGGCSTCWGQALGCVFGQCLGECSEGGPGSDACVNCASAKCGAAFEECSGTPLDLGETTGEDCPDGCPPGSFCNQNGMCQEEQGGCMSNEECGPNMVCNDGQCTPDGGGGQCDPPCPEGTECTEGQCVIPPNTPCGSVSFEGCCNGDVLQYCEADVVKGGQCEANTCGWDTEGNFYNCNTAGGEDPSGANPKACK